MNRIVVIEDGPGPWLELTAILGRQGIDVSHYDDGVDGLHAARGQDVVMVVLGVEIPRLSGYSICNKLRKDPALAGRPILMTYRQESADAIKEHPSLGMEISAYVSRPYTATMMLKEICKFDLTPRRDAPESPHPSPHTDIAAELGVSTTVTPNLSPAARERIGHAISLIEQALGRLGG